MDGGGGIRIESAHSSVMKVYSPMLLPLGEGGSVKCPDKKRYVTVEWLLVHE